MHKVCKIINVTCLSESSLYPMRINVFFIEVKKNNRCEKIFFNFQFSIFIFYYYLCTRK